MIHLVPFSLLLLAKVGNVRSEGKFEALPPTISNYIYVNVSGCLAFFARKIELTLGENLDESVNLEPSQMLLNGDSFCSTEKSRLSLEWINVTSKLFSVGIRMDFELNVNGYWSLGSGNISLNNIIYSLNLIWPSLPAKMGYKCLHTAPVLVSNSSKVAKVTFTGMQVQPFNADSGRFLDASDCVGFFSTGILSNLLIVFLLIGIFFYGLVMVIGIQSNDSFDDPKTKMIQLGTSPD